MQQPSPVDCSKDGQDALPKAAAVSLIVSHDDAILLAYASRSHFCARLLRYPVKEGERCREESAK